MPGFEPQTDVHLTTVNLTFTQNVTAVIPLLAVPDGANFQLELLSVHSVVGDDFPAGGTLSVRYGTTDDSDSQNETLLGDATINPESGGDLGSTDFVSTSSMRGSVILDPGDTVYAICIADNNAVTFPHGLTAVVEYRILRRS